jgi:hypothetical protein
MKPIGGQIDPVSKTLFYLIPDDEGSIKDLVILSVIQHRLESESSRDRQ